jgi:hypothetical protein
MTLYVCWGTFSTFGAGHPCGNADRALRAAGIAPRVVRARGWGLLPSWLNRTAGRREVRRLTGSDWVPVLVTDNGEVVRGSQAIVAWAAARAR